MMTAEQARDERIRQLSDSQLLAYLKSATIDAELTPYESAAFGAMRGRLSASQRRWACDVARRVMPLLAAEVPRGREVATPKALQILPKQPPGRLCTGSDVGHGIDRDPLAKERRR